MQISGSSGAKTLSFVVYIELVDPCLTVDLDLLPNPLVDVTYVLYDPAMEQSWKIEDLLAPLQTQVDCGPISVEFFNSGDLSPLDSVLFVDDQTSAPSNFFRTL